MSEGTTTSKFQHRGAMASRFGVCDGGRYANDWAIHIDDVLSALAAAEARAEKAQGVIEQVLDALDDAIAAVVNEGQGWTQGDYDVWDSARAAARAALAAASSPGETE